MASRSSHGPRSRDCETEPVAITGVHALLYSAEADRLRATLRDLLGLDHVDTGGGWLIFALPPAELGVHPGDEAHHEISLMCDDIESTVAELRAKGVTFKGDIDARRFGRTATMVLPGDVEMLLYEPSHPTAI
jgi:hypothetical protein